MPSKLSTEVKKSAAVDNSESTRKARSASTISIKSDKSAVSKEIGSSRRSKADASKSKSKSVSEKKTKPSSKKKKKTKSKSPSSKKSKNSKSGSEKSVNKKKSEVRRKPSIVDNKEDSIKSVATVIAEPRLEQLLKTSRKIPKKSSKVKAVSTKDVIAVETGGDVPRVVGTVRRRNVKRSIDDLSSHREFDECGCMGFHFDIVFSSFFVALASLAIDVILSFVCSFFVISACSFALPAFHAGASIMLIFAFLFQKPYFYIPFLIFNSIYVFILAVGVVCLSAAFIGLMMFWDVVLVNLTISEISLAFYASTLLSAVFICLFLTTLTVWFQMTISRARTILFFNKWREINH